MSYLILCGYLSLVGLSVARIRRINLYSLTFADGILVGLLFYIGVPLALIFYQGYLFSYDLSLGVYNPYTDVSTTLNIYFGWLVVLLLHRVSNGSSYRGDGDKATKSLKIMFVLYVVFSIYSFFKAGMSGDAAHWHESLSEVLADSTVLIIIKNFAFAYRTMLFGLIFYLYRVGRLSVAGTIALGAFVATFDMLMTYNRITIVYFFILTYIVFIRFWLIYLVLTFAAIPFAMIFSNFWAIFRASKRGNSLDAFADAALLASDVMKGSKPLIVNMNGVFESSNILVLNYVVKNIGGDFPVLWGATFLVRPLTTFLPSSLWPGKPKVFGTYLGKQIHNHETLTLNSTLFGEAIGNFYYLWPVVLFLVLFAVNKLFNSIGKWIPASGFMAFFVAIGLWRFDMNFTSACLYALVLAELCYLLAYRRFQWR
jgi:hypothetical protein